MPMQPDDQFTIKVTKLRDGSVNVRCVYENQSRIVGEWFVSPDVPLVRIDVTLDTVKITGESK